jgi:hypothetical protein
MKPGKGLSREATRGDVTVINLAIKLQIPIAVALLKNGKIIFSLKEP